MLKFLLIAALLGSAGGIGGGSVVAHLKTADAKASVVQIALGKAGKKNQLSVPGVSLAAGDQLQRPFELASTSKTPLATIALTTSAAPTSPLDTDPVNGLQIRIDRCSGSWKLDKRTRRYSCPQTVTPVVAQRPVIGANLPLAGLGDLLARKAKARLLLTVFLPATAGNAFQGKSSSVTYTFTAAEAGSRSR